MQYIEPSKKPYPFCPGCSHTQIIDAIGTALEKTNSDPKKTVLVSDIGCMGIIDHYFNIHTLHGLHGRSFTYASGIKLSNPDLNVFVIVGDGGCGIGGHHLINAARRNIGIKVICFDNFNFGMTGGEHSVTTPLKGKTHTTPSGNMERPFDLCSLVQAAGSGFVARKTAFDKDLSDTIAEAFGHDGFAFIDVLEVCAAYYMTLNDYKKTELMKMVEDNNLKLGILTNNNIPEYSKSLRTLWPVDKKFTPLPDIIEKKFLSSITNEFSIVLAGSAGQKTISASTNLAEAAISAGLFASQQNDYPVTVQTGFSLSEVKLSPKKIHYPCSDNPDAILIVSEDGLIAAKEILPRLNEDSVVITNRNLDSISTKARVLFADYDKHHLTKTNFMTAAIAVLLSVKNIFEAKAFLSSLESINNEKIRESNVSAFNAGLAIAKEMS